MVKYLRSTSLGYHKTTEILYNPFIFLGEGGVEVCDYKRQEAKKKKKNLGANSPGPCLDASEGAWLSPPCQGEGEGHFMKLLLSKVVEAAASHGRFIGHAPRKGGCI